MQRSLDITLLVIINVNPIHHNFVDFGMLQPPNYQKIFAYFFFELLYATDLIVWAFLVPVFLLIKFLFCKV